MLTSSYTPQLYRGAEDLRALLALVAARPARLAAAYPSCTDLREICATPDGQAAAHLWVDSAGEAQGFTLFDGGFLSFEVGPRAGFDRLAGQMIAWAADCLSAAPPAEEDGQPPALWTGCREEDGPRIAFLERQGFTAEAVRTLHFRRALDEPIPAPRLPDGFTIRLADGEAEAEAWVALHRAAHGTQSMTLDYRLAMLRAPGYDPRLDLVAAAPDGSLAAYVVGHISAEENRLSGEQVGYTDPVATHPNWQGRGLARALLGAACARLKARGMAFAALGTWGENAAMIRAAESAGFRRCSSTIFYTRPL